VVVNCGKTNVTNKDPVNKHDQNMKGMLYENKNRGGTLLFKW